MTSPTPTTTGSSATDDEPHPMLAAGVIAAQVDHDRFEIRPLPSTVRVDRDVVVTTSTGERVALNLFRPEGDGPFPVVCALTSYGKDLHPIDYMLRDRGPTFRSIGLRMGEFAVSDATPFEAPDPAPWVAAGYAVAHVDALGTGKSSGQPGLALGPAVVDGFVTTIEWLADQPWSNGRVGLTGVSYLAIIQWFVAARRPRGLAAICPWEGMTDPFSDAMFHGGIPETAFIPWWLGARTDSLGSDTPPTFTRTRPAIPETDFAGRLAAGMTPRRSAFPLPAPDLAAIDVPALICASWSAQGVHSRGAFEAWRRIGSTTKHLYTHGRHEWTVSNSVDAFDTQRAFFDRHLAGRTDTAELPTVRLETRLSATEYRVRNETAWPLPNTRTTEFHLHPDGHLTSAAATGGAVTFEATSDQHARFIHTFDQHTEITGPAALRVWISTDTGEDMDVFVVLRKLDPDGNEVGFWNLLQPHDVVTRGWLRASQRTLDQANSDALRPVPAYTGELAVPLNTPIRLDIELLPSSTWFEAGSTIALDIGARDLAINPMQQHLQLFNTGHHTIHTGPDTPSALLLPIIHP
jgi:predicted acyl esterase